MISYQLKIAQLLIILLTISIVISCSTDSTSVFTLTANLDPYEGGTVVQSASQRNEGESILISAIPNQHWTFVGWTGDHTGDVNEVEILMDQNKIVNAIFQKREYPITIEIIGKGTVTEEIVQEKSTDYQYGTVVRLTTVPDDGWVFADWHGDTQSTDPVINVNVESGKNIIARFVLMPSISTSSITQIKPNSAVSGGTITNNSHITITDRALCWGTSKDSNPLTNKSLTCKQLGPGGDTYTIQMNGLNPSTKYYVRAILEYSIHGNKDIVLGQEHPFTTADPLKRPTISTTSISSINTNSAVSGGHIASSGGAQVTKRGICVSTSQNPTTNHHCSSNGIGAGTYSSTISRLSASTTYYARAFATNSQGTAYGNQRSFKTAAAQATPSTPSSSGVEVALVFLDGVNFDVTINGVLIPASRGFNYRFGHSGVKVVNLSGNLSSMQLNPGQIRRSVNNQGFGFFSYKVVNKDPGTNLYAINGNHNGNPLFWGQPASSNPLGVIVNRSGDTVNNTRYPDSLFYLGWRFDPVNQPNNRNFQSGWSSTRKVVISFFNLGQNHPNPAVP